MSDVTLFHGDCLEFMKGMEAESVDAVITDPPYPNMYQEEYKYKDGTLDFLNLFQCRQFVFWTITEPFPLTFTARHKWDKITGTYARYEYIYERNGDVKEYEFKYQKYNNWVDAQFYRDKKYDHPSQKNLAHLKKMIYLFTQPTDTIFDPFMGSGTTGVAAVQLGRSFIGCEIDPQYFAIAQKRIAEAKLQPALFQLDSKPQAVQAELI